MLDLPDNYPMLPIRQAWGDPLWKYGITVLIVADTSEGIFKVLSDGEEKNEYDTGSIGLPILFVYYLSY